MSLIKKEKRGYNPIEEKRRTNRINTLSKENKELQEELKEARDKLEAERVKVWAYEESNKFLDNEVSMLKLQLLQKNIKIEKAIHMLGVNISKQPDLNTQTLKDNTEDIRREERADRLHELKESTTKAQEGLMRSL